MNSWVSRVLGRIVTLRDGEGSIALLMFAYSFLAMTSYNILKPLAESEFIDRLGSDNRPYVLLATGVLIGVLMHGYSAAVARLRREHVIPITQAVVVVLLLVFSLLLRTAAAWVTVVFFLFAQILGVLLISQFWTLANDLYDARQAKRVFGFVGAGASLGSALGAGITTLIVEEAGTDNLLIVSGAVLAGCLLLVMTIQRRRGPATRGPDETGVGTHEALRLLRESRHLQVVALAVGCAAAGAAIVQQQLSMAAQAMKGAGGAEGIAAYLSLVTVYLSLAGFVVQVALTSRIHRSLGLAFALLLLPVALGSMATMILVTGAFWAPAVARVLDSTLRYTIDKTSREVLFLPLPAELKYRAKPFIDVTMDRFAKGFAAVVILLLIKPWGLNLDWRELSYASIGVTLVWIAAALVARRQYLNSFRESIGARTLAADSVRVDIGDPATIETLVEELSNPDPGAVLYAIGMLEALDKRNLISPLLLHHESPQVRARVLRALGAVRSRIALRWRPAVERLLHDPDVEVRAAALRALAALSHEDAATLMRRHLSDPEPQVAVTAAVTLAASDRPDDLAASEQTLQRLIADTRDLAADGRCEAAKALAHIGAPRFRPLLVPLLYDHDVRVVQQAIRSARAMGAADGLFLPGLISRLGHRTLKTAARDALVGYGEAAIDALAYALADRREAAWVRRHIPATLALIPTQASMNALVASLDDPDGFLRYKSIAAIEALHVRHPSLSFPSAVIEALALQEAARYYNHLSLREDVLRAATPRDTLLVRALDEKLQRTLDRMYKLLGLMYDVGHVAAARYTIEHGDARKRAGAVEYLDNLLTGPVRRRVLPIVEDTPIAEKLRHAYLTLKTRPRDIDDALARIVHEDDAVLSAAAVHVITQRRMWTLVHDVEYVLAHRSPDDRVAVEAAAWALRRRRTGDQEAANEPLPIVELAHRVRMIPLFEFVSVDELFRIAAIGEEARYPAGRELLHPGATPQHVEFLLEGAVRVIEPSGGTREIGAPAALGLEDVLQGAPPTVTIRAAESVVCFRIAAGALLTMVSDNVLLAQSLFRMLLAQAAADGRCDEIRPSSGAVELLRPIDQALLLRENLLLARATPAHLLALVEAGREVPLAEGSVLFEPGDPPAVYQLLDGELLLESGPAAQTAGPGSTIGMAGALSGNGTPCRAVARRKGRALRIDREDLFAVLGDHVDLMQGVFSEVLALPRKDIAAAASQA